MLSHPCVFQCFSNVYSVSAVWVGYGFLYLEVCRTPSLPFLSSRFIQLMGKIWHALFLEAVLGFVFGLGSWMGFVLLFCWFFKLFFCGLLVCLVCVDLFVFPTYCLLSVVFFFPSLSLSNYSWKFMKQNQCQKITHNGIQQQRVMRTRKTARALKTVLRRKRKRRKMMIKHTVDSLHYLHTLGLTVEFVQLTKKHSTEALRRLSLNFLYQLRVHYVTSQWR